jgi:phosphate transport system protein
MSEHTSKQFDHELENVRARVLQMGGLVEEQTVRALQALTSGDLELTRRVIEDDHRVNAMEVTLDEECSTIIARRQPAAGDLRMLMTVVKTITDLERIGDEAEKIARMTQLIYGSDRMPVPRVVEIKHVANVALEMLRMALDAFARMDLSAAAEVVRRDQQVDEEFRSILRQLITFMMEDPRTITHALEILFIAKAIERIGDHAKNMSEYVVYMVKGKDVRHLTPEVFVREAIGG